MSAKLKLFSIISFIFLLVASLSVGVWALTSIEDFKVTGSLTVSPAITVDINNCPFVFDDYFVAGSWPIDEANERVLARCTDYTSEEIIIPAFVTDGTNTWKVIGIGDAEQGIFYQEEYATNVNVKKIVIPNTIRVIANEAFEGCPKLESLEIPDSVTVIENLNFSDLNLKSIVVDKNNPVYDSRNNCNAIIETATNKLIMGCKNTIIPNSVRIIGDSAFWGIDFANITIPFGVTTIENLAFYVSGLESIELPNTLTSIGSSAFAGCRKLKTASLPDNLTYMADRAFSDCSALTTINIPLNLTAILDYTFYYCLSLQNIEFPDGLTSIGTEAFYYCNSLLKIEIPNSVMSIGKGAFMSCGKLQQLSIPFVGGSATENQFLSYIFGSSSATEEEDTRRVPSTLKDLIITNQSFIPGNAFYYCINLVSIRYFMGTEGDSANTIGSGAFYGCGLKYLYLPPVVSLPSFSSFAAGAVLVIPTNQLCQIASASYLPTKVFVDARYVNEYESANSSYASKFIGWHFV